MTRPGAPLFIALLLATTGCATRAPMVAIRPANVSSAVQESTASAQFQQAQGHLALGSVALALEGFRRTIRLDPHHVEAMLGIADCYERMGRIDVASVYFEKALAATPNDGRVYALFAAALERNGMIAEAARLRSEIAARGGPRGGASLAEGKADVPQLGETAARIALQKSMDLAAKDAAPPLAMPTPGAEIRTAQSINIVRIERINLHEVALRTSVTSPLPTPAATSSKALQQAQLAASAKRQQSAARLTVLNAARIAGLAARTRRLLRAVSPGQILIGDAPLVLGRSEIRYAADRSGEARRLSGRLGIPLRPARLPNGSLVLWLGRDATRLGLSS